MPPSSSGASRSKESTLSDPPRIFGRYALLSSLEEGSVETYHALEVLPRGERRPCLVRRLAKGCLDDAPIRALFEEELRLGSRLDHPSIVRQLAAGEVDGVPFGSFELVEGTTLDRVQQLMEPALMPISTAVEIALRIAVALSYVQGLAPVTGEPSLSSHDHLEPKVIGLSKIGELKISGFARRIPPRPGTTGERSPSYLAPEQIRGGKSLGGRTDLFSLGVILAELLTGNLLLPLGVEGIEDLESAVRERCTAFRPEAPRELVDLIVRMTRIAPEERTASAREVLHDLRALLDGMGARVRLGAYMFLEVLPRLGGGDPGALREPVFSDRAEMSTASTPGIDASELRTVVTRAPLSSDE